MKNIVNEVAKLLTTSSTSASVFINESLLALLCYMGTLLVMVICYTQSITYGTTTTIMSD